MSFILVMVPICTAIWLFLLALSVIALEALNEYGNCLLWSYGQKLRYGGQVKAVKSHNYPGPHFIYVVGKDHPVWREGDRYERVPLFPKKRLIPPPFHRGFVRAA